MKKAIIFDLDNCLAPALAVGEELYAPAFNAIRQANRGALSEHSLQQAFNDIWRHPLDWVAEHYGFSCDMTTAAWDFFRKMEVSRPMQGYPDLEVLAELPVQLFLVTSGFRRLQESKIKALGLQNRFSAIFVDAIDEPDRLGKLALFRRILERFHLQPGEVWVVGDNPSSEIDAGNQLGIETVQTLRPGVARARTARYHVRSLTELGKMLGENKS